MSHFLTDALASEVDFDGFDAIVLPGGMPWELLKSWSKRHGQ